MHINKFTLSFKGKIEKIFIDNYLTQSLPQIRIGSIIAIFLYTLFGILDAYLLPNSDKQILWMIRYLGFCPLCLLIFTFSFFPFFKKHGYFYLSILAFCSGLGILLMIAFSDPPINFLYYAGLMLVFIFCFTFLRLRFIHTTIVGWSLILIYEFISLQINKTPFPIFLNNNFFLLSANIMGMFTSYSMEYYARSNFFLVNELAQKAIAHEKAKKEIQKFKTIADTANYGVIIFDTNYILLYINHSFAKMHKYSIEELHNKELSFVHTKSQINHIKQLNKQLIENESYSAEEVWHKKKNGEIFPTLMNGISVKDNNNKIIFFSATVIDITAKKEQEKERERLELQLRNAQKMETIGTLAGGIAHDFNNSLAVIFGYTDMLMNKFTNDSSIYKNLKRILNSAAYCKSLVKQILTFSRQERNERQVLFVHNIIKTTVDLINNSIPHFIKIRTNINNSCPAIFANAAEVQQIIDNLCKNAIHAMQEHGGILDIHLKTVYLNSAFVKKHIELREGNHVCLTVNDTGCGMSQDTIDKIFDPFFTTKKVGEGPGLGLAVIHGIVSSYGGKIIVYSELQKGTSFHVYFPAIQQQTKKEPSPIENNNSNINEKKRILFIDHDKENVLMGKQSLSKLGYMINTQTNSTKALEIFKNNPKDFDLVITDQTMPNLPGNILAKEILKVRSDIPIILLTGFSSIVNENNYKKFGIRKFIMKPILPNDLNNVIKTVISEK